MAATRLIALHINKGKTVAQTLSARTDYSENAAKTNNGEFISAYECDPKTADEEFLLSKRQYDQITGRRQRRDVIAYQIRQSFKPGEITPEQANQVGYETAMRWTKGKHAFLVATHIDRAHIHNHIIYNSTSLDCTRKYRNFFYSGLALQRLSDLVCLEHGLSVIQPKPKEERVRRTEYPKRTRFRDELCRTIDSCLQQNPKDFEELLQLLMDAGVEVKRGKHPALRGKGQKRFLRFRSLGEGYSEEELTAALTGKSKTKRPQDKRLSLLVDIQMKLAQGKGPGYERWAKLFNLKQMSRVLCFLDEQGVDSIEALREQAAASAEQFDQLSKSIKASEQRLAEIAVLKTHITNYIKTRNTFVEYRKSGYSRQFFEAHRQELTLHKAAKAAFDQLGVKKLPTVKDLSAEYAQVLTKKKQAYADYRIARKQMQEYQVALKNVEAMLGLEQQQQANERREEKTK